MPDDRTTGRTLADEAVPMITVQVGAEQGRPRAEPAECLSAQTFDVVNQLVEDTARVSQELTNRATQNLQALIHLTELSACGWQQAASELSQQTQQMIDHQIRAFNAAFQVCRPEQLYDLHSDFVTERLQAQLGTSARLAQITADLTAHVAQRLQPQA
jgi:hypothetical protein